MQAASEEKIREGDPDWVPASEFEAKQYEMKIRRRVSSMLNEFSRNMSR